jgi:hypothetical protein
MLEYTVAAADGELGPVVDFYFDAFNWEVRYLVVDAEPAAFGRRVPLAPESIESIDHEAERVEVALSSDEIRRSPTVDESIPLSRRTEAELAKHYGWQAYWEDYQAVTTDPHAAEVPLASSQADPAAPEQQAPEHPAERDLALRSATEVFGYAVEAMDGTPGQLLDLLIDAEAWVVRYLVAETEGVPGGHPVLLSPAWVQEIDWEQKRIRMDISADQVKQAPEWKPGEPVDRAFEERVYDHYGRPRYWESR